MHDLRLYSYLGLVLRDDVVGPVLDVEIHSCEAEDGVYQAKQTTSVTVREY
jgi:hypothetical protein